MADIEMDVDINRPLGGDLRAHDEIDFDMDMIDDLDQPRKDTDLNMDKDMREVDSATNHEASFQNGTIDEDVDIDVDVEDAGPDLENDDEMFGELAVETQQTDQVDVSQEYAQQNIVTAKAWTVVDDVEPPAAEEDHESPHEIDYEFEEIDPQQNSSEYKDTNGVTDQGTADIEHPTEVAGEETAPPAADAPVEKLETGTIADSVDVVEDDDHQEEYHGDHQEGAHFEEVDYEHHENTVENGSTQANDTDGLATKEGKDETHVGQEAESEFDELHGEAADGADSENSAEPQAHISDEQEANHDGSHVGAEEHKDGVELSNPEDVDESVAEPQSHEDFTHDFPAITVQYKGDEYPFFSTTSSGFFRETYVLDESMDKILRGFRDELANELTHEDELVFQVDELGLEFAESTGSEITSSITLRQILEIHDLLVKNQDPDGVRNLYAYLFVKPNASKRLEFLVESATQGKGLDEVIHLFESTVPPGPSLLESNDAVDETDEHLDAYDSHTDDAEQDQDERSRRYDGQDEEHNEHEQDNSEHHGGEDELGEDDTKNVEGDVANPELSHPEAYQDASNDAETHAEANDVEADDIEEGSAEADDGEMDSGNAELAVEQEQSEADDHDDSEANPYANLELDETDYVNNANDELEHEGGEEYDEQTTIATNVAEVETVHTSSTATLLDNDDAESVNIDIGANADADADADTEVHADVHEDQSTNGDKVEPAAPDEDDELAEIDWRDEDEIGAPEADAEATVTSPTAGKRARADDDEDDGEDEQDTKRRRP